MFLEIIMIFFFTSLYTWLQAKAGFQIAAGQAMHVSSGRVIDIESLKNDKNPTLNFLGL
jgi:hypothetical protein